MREFDKVILIKNIHDQRDDLILDWLDGYFTSDDMKQVMKMEHARRHFRN